MSKKIKVILLIIMSVIGLLISDVLLLDWYAAKYPQKNIGNGGIASDSRLADPDLLYVYLYSAGLCSNSKGEQGGCYTEVYLYNSGRLVKEIGFEGIDGKKEILPDEINLSREAVDGIAKIISEFGILGKDCPSEQIMDAGWDYQVNLNGVKKMFHNPAADCKSVFININAAINSAAGNIVID